MTTSLSRMKPEKTGAGAAKQPRRRAAAAREPLVEQVQRALGLGAGNVERVVGVGADGLRGAFFLRSGAARARRVLG
jgi:hypothetical protein